MRSTWLMALATVTILLGANRFPLIAEEPTLTPSRQPANDDSSDNAEGASARLKTATFGTGCFWCTEAVFEQLHGVRDVVSGYIGGKVANPTYEQVCSGMTGHAEAVEITFDPTEISYAQLLEVFWKTHDPTTLNRQGNDVGTQYRSAVFYHDEEQKELAEHYKEKLNNEKAFRDPIVTEITAASQFYPAEKYHQDYYRANPTQGYCSLVIRPKLEKFEKAFGDKLQSARK